MQEQAMLAMFRRRDESVLTHAQKQFGSYCYTIAYNILGNEQDAEECVNDTWLNLWNSIPPAEPESLYAFTAAVTRNLAKNRWKAAHRQRRGGGEAAIALEELLGEPAARDDVEREVDSRALGEALNAFLGTLSEDHRKIFVQRYWYFCPVDDIAADLGVTKSKVTVTLMRTRKKLHDYLEKEGLL